MLFLAQCIVIIVRIFPKNWKFSWRLRWLLYYNECEKRVIAWHKAELEKLDSGFRLQQAEFKLVAARTKAHREGIEPEDPRYPDIFDFVPFPNLDEIMKK